MKMQQLAFIHSFIVTALMTRKIRWPTYCDVEFFSGVGPLYPLSRHKE